MKLLVISLVLSVVLYGAFANRDYNVAYKAFSNGKYWTRVVHNHIAASSSSKNQETTFTRMNLANGKTKLWSPTAQAYLCRVDRGSDGNYLEAYPGRDDARCQFSPVNSGTGYVRYRADNGAYLCVVRERGYDFIKIQGNTPCDHFEEVLHQY